MYNYKKNGITHLIEESLSLKKKEEEEKSFLVDIVNRSGDNRLLSFQTILTFEIGTAFV